MKASKTIIIWSVIGALFGFFIFHPLIHAISVFHVSSGFTVKVNFFSEILNAFSFSMLPWSISFIILTALLGLFWGKFTLADKEKSKVISELHEALAKVKTLSGYLPICSSCKKIRDDKGYWNQIETYIREHSEAEFSHSICPKCAKKLYPDIYPDNQST